MPWCVLSGLWVSRSCVSGGAAVLDRCLNGMTCCVRQQLFIYISSGRGTTCPGHAVAGFGHYTTKMHPHTCIARLSGDGRGRRRGSRSSAAAPGRPVADAAPRGLRSGAVPAVSCLLRGCEAPHQAAASPISCVNAAHTVQLRCYSCFRFSAVALENFICFPAPHAVQHVPSCCAVTTYPPV